MNEATTERPVVERTAEELAAIREAKAKLQQVMGWSEPAAHRFLQKASMETHLSMAELAQLVLGTPPSRWFPSDVLAAARKRERRRYPEIGRGIRRRAAHADPHGRALRAHNDPCLDLGGEG